MYTYALHLQFKKQSTAGCPCSSVITKSNTYWDECLPSSFPFKPGSYGEPFVPKIQIASVNPNS